MHNGNEIEFEFVPGMNGGALLASGNVVTTVREMVSAGRLEEAAELLAGSADGVGDEVLESLAIGASRELVARFTEVFVAAGDMRRAAACAESLGNRELALRLLASEADLPGDADDPIAAAEALERSGQHLAAGKRFTQAGRWDRAVAALSKVGARTDDFVEAGWLLGNIYERSGQPEVATNYYLCVLKQRSLSDETRELALRLAALLDGAGRAADAGRLRERVRALDHDRALLGGARSEAQRHSQSHAPEETPGGAAELVQVVAHSAAPKTPARPTVAPAPRAGAIPPAELALLEAAQLFVGLTPAERRAVLTLAERVELAAGASLTRAGAPSAALFVIVRGHVQLIGRNMDDDRFPLGSIGPGQHAGELALLDDGPCAFDAVTERTVVAYRFEVEALRGLLEHEPRLGLVVYRAAAAELGERFRALRRWLPASRVTRTAQVPSVPRL
jgi:tetratricopeptide (TPR) repeat protein